MPGRIRDTAELLSDGVDFVDYIGHFLVVEDDSMELLAAGLDVEVKLLLVLLVQERA